MIIKTKSSEKVFLPLFEMYINFIKTNLSVYKNCWLLTEMNHGLYVNARENWLSFAMIVLKGA